MHNLEHQKMKILSKIIICVTASISVRILILFRFQSSNNPLKQFSGSNFTASRPKSTTKLKKIKL